MYNHEGIGRTETRQLTLFDLQEIIEQLSDVDGHVAVLTTISSPDFGVKQSIVLCKEVSV